ncbi:hypothetical protein PAAG_12253 [Paracoccidioides lutzii Pb01]|uniref:Uncharacterized protein n=1 Tax=Paracoccidioides lutzii (strain ATCC MYA-826 / Pb01) TaxID=502779 RepID=A0A0A2VJJ3_PARBA|nr:hypothetical protein PAAG_12253 [Paracoccidioides lutzii Pb01]KGQ01059.1 hypothetical protein PAAG_12253 [Paracoccidioides lutzii Pb01]
MDKTRRIVEITGFFKLLWLAGWWSLFALNRAHVGVKPPGFATSFTHPGFRLFTSTQPRLRQQSSHSPHPSYNLTPSILQPSQHTPVDGLQLLVRLSSRFPALSTNEVITHHSESSSSPVYLYPSLVFCTIPFPSPTASYPNPSVKTLPTHLGYTSIHTRISHSQPTISAAPIPLSLLCVFIYTVLTVSPLSSADKLLVPLSDIFLPSLAQQSTPISLKPLNLPSKSVGILHNSSQFFQSGSLVRCDEIDGTQESPFG